MELEEYFQSTKGRGVLATADKDGKVDVAVYSKPHFIDVNTVVFIITEKLTYVNLKSNPYAAYLFSEEEQKYHGKRLYLRKIREEKNPDLITQICRKCDYSQYETKNRYVVFFNIEKVLPLIGSIESN